MPSELSAPACNALSVTPNDSATLVDANGKQVISRALYIGVTGDVKVDMCGNLATGQAGAIGVTFKSVAVGILPVQVNKVYSTGTTASQIIAMY